MSKPGPKAAGRLAKTGEYCPPGSEGTRVYTGKRPFNKTCRVCKGPKFHPGRCIECLHKKEKRRDSKPERLEKKRLAYQRWIAKPKNRAKVAEKARKRNAIREQKDAAAYRQRLYRRGLKVNPQSNPVEVAARLVAKATALAKQRQYGIIQIGNYNA